jgi:hypothetical protein
MKQVRTFTDSDTASAEQLANEWLKQNGDDIEVLNTSLSTYPASSNRVRGTYVKDFRITRIILVCYEMRSSV